MACHADNSLSLPVSVSMSSVQLKGHVEVASARQAVTAGRVTSVFPDRRRQAVRPEGGRERRSPVSRLARGRWVARGEIILSGSDPLLIPSPDEGVARFRADEIEFDLLALKPVEGAGEGHFQFVALCDPTPEQLARLPREPGMGSPNSAREERMVAMLRLLREGIGRRDLTWELARRVPEEGTGGTRVSSSLVKNDLSMSLNWILRGVRVGKRPAALPEDLWPPERVRARVLPLILKKPVQARHVILDWLSSGDG
jgi:hypothetical protein